MPVLFLFFLFSFFLPKVVTEGSLLKADEWWLADLASYLQMPVATLHRWRRVDWLTSHKVSQSNRWIIYADADEMARLQTLRHTRRGWPDPYPRHLISPKPNPNTSPASADC